MAVAAYHQAPPRIRARFDEVVARLHGEAITLIGDVSAALKERNYSRLDAACQYAGDRLRILIEEADAIATGEATPRRGVIDALFRRR